MTKITIPRAVVEQALEALKDYKRSDDDRVSIAMHILDAALHATLAEPEPCQYPDCVDNGPEGKCTRWLLDECSKSEDYKSQRPAEPDTDCHAQGICQRSGYSVGQRKPVQEPQEHLLQQALEALLMMRDRYGEYACPACDHADAAVYALKDALAEDALQRLTDVQQEIEAALAEPVPPIGKASTDAPVPVYVLKKAEPPCNPSCAPGYCYCEPVQEPFGYLWPTGMHPEFRFTQQQRDGVDGMPLYAAPPQRKPLSEKEIERICAPLGFAQLSPVEVTRAVEAAHGIKEGT